MIYVTLRKSYSASPPSLSYPTVTGGGSGGCDVSGRDSSGAVAGSANDDDDVISSGCDDDVSSAICGDDVGVAKFCFDFDVDPIILEPLRLPRLGGGIGGVVVVAVVLLFCGVACVAPVAVPVRLLCVGVTIVGIPPVVLFLSF